MGPIESLEGLSSQFALEQIGKLIDISYNLKRTDGLKKAIKLSEELRKRQISPEQSSTLHYFQANAWANLRKLRDTKEIQSLDWEKIEAEKEIFHLLSAYHSKEFPGLLKQRRCQILTNLANIFDSIGRFIKAKDYWDKALNIIPSFAMAQGNRGYGLAFFASMLYNRDHAKLFCRQAYSDLKSSLKEPLNNEAKDVFKNVLIKIESIIDLDYLRDEIDMDSFTMGDSDEEIQFRRWCLKNRLFLNPLNDLGPFPIAARDVLIIPGIVVKLDEGPYYPGFFNQIKQEFVSARYLYYEGINLSTKTHFSDKGVVLFNTLDYPSYSLASEKVKAGYRIAYSLFDKIAYFMNHYYRLSIPEKNISFSTFWFEPKEKQKRFRREFHYAKNLPLRGLFWLGKDLYENKPGFRELINPDARALFEIRNHLEHRYLKLHENDWHDYSSDSGWMTDSLAYSMYRKSFEQKTLELIKMIREAIIYLCLSIHCEEKRRAKYREVDKKIVPMSFGVLDDDLKR